MTATRIYYTFSALLGLGLGATVTVYAPFLLSLGLSLGEVALVNSFFWFILIISELPTGMLADGRSRAWSLKIGMVFHAVGALAYFFATGFWSAVIGEGLIAIAMAFMSGCQTAWITDALAREGKQDQIRNVYATEMMIKTALFIFGGFIGAALSLVSYRLIWVPMVFTSIIAFIFSHRFMNGQGEPIERVSELEAFARSLAHLRASRALKWLIGAMILFGSVVSFNHFWAPYFEPRVGTLGLSWVWAIIYLSFLPSGWLVRRLSIALGREANMIVLSIFGSGLGLALASLGGGMIFLLSSAAVHELGRGMFQPLTDSFVQHRVQSAYRATFGSLQNFLGRIGFAFVPLVVWIGIDGKPDTPETIAEVWLICGVLMCIGATLFYFLRPRA